MGRFTGDNDHGQPITTGSPDSSIGGGNAAGGDSYLNFHNCHHVHILEVISALLHKMMKLSPLDQVTVIVGSYEVTVMGPSKSVTSGGPAPLIVISRRPGAPKS